MALDPRLNGLSTESLNELKEKIDAILKDRRSLAMQIGSLVSFENSRDGERVYMVIDRINTKSISGKKIDPQTGIATKQQWRVSHGLLRMETTPPWAPKPAERPKPAPVGSDKPRSAVPTF